MLLEISGYPTYQDLGRWNFPEPDFSAGMTSGWSVIRPELSVTIRGTAVVTATR
jgi:hypothetical protein